MIPVIDGGHALDAVIANPARMLTYVENRMVPLPDDERYPVVAWEENLHTLHPCEMLDRYSSLCAEMQRDDQWDRRGRLFESGGCRNAYNRKPYKRGAGTESDLDRGVAWRARVRPPLESRQYFAKLAKARREWFLTTSVDAVQWGLREGLISFERPNRRSEFWRVL